jgi:microcystin-dependent protein
MEKVIGNYTKQTDFPLDEETLVALQSNQALIEVLGNIAGDKVIVYGCTLSQDGTQRSRGYIFLRTDDFPNGEILEFEGGSVGSGYFYLQKTAVDVDANGQVYSAAYTRRYLSEGLGEERFEWADVTELTTTKELAARLAQLRSDVDALLATPVGVIQQWAGTVSDDAIPENYVLCDGRQLSTSQYPELYAVLGTRFGYSSGFFRVPDLRGRFVVGYSDTDSDYTTMGSTGGEKKHTLSVAEMPEHRHRIGLGQAWWGGASDRRNYLQYGGGDGIDEYNNTEEWRGKNYTDEMGAGESHENRPPYMVLAYIIKAR